MIIICFLQTGCQPIGVSDDLSLLELHNHARTNGVYCGSIIKHKAPELRWNALLAQAAKNHSLEMYTQQKTSHTNIAKLNPGKRIRAAGYDWRSYAENIAAGVFTDTAVFELWLNSPAHCTNIANSDYTEMGAAQVNGYWTALYAKPQ